VIISVLGTFLILWPYNITGSCVVAPPIAWDKTWGGKDPEIMHDMVIDSSKDIFIAGEIRKSNNSRNEIFLLKINESLDYNITWGEQMQVEFCGMALDTEDNIFISGTLTDNISRTKDVFLLKYSNNLTLEWFKFWGGGGNKSCTAIEVDSQDNIYIAGIMNFPKNDTFLIKYNSSGVIQWNCTWTTGVHNISEEVLSLVIDSTDQVILGVKTNLTGSEWYLLKYNSSGNLISNSSYNKHIPLEHLILDSTDNLYAIGSLNDMYLTKFDNNGNLEWNLTCIQDILHGTESTGIDHSDNIYIAGNVLINASAILYGYNMTDYDTYLMKFNNTGGLQWNETISHSNNLYLDILAFDPLGNIYLGGSLEMIAPGSLCYKLEIFDDLGNQKRTHGGGCIYGDSACKGIYAVSPNNFIAAINSPCNNTENYDIRVIKYTEYDFSHCPPILDPWLLLTLNIGLSTIFITLGISYLVIKEKKRKKIGMD